MLMYKWASSFKNYITVNTHFFSVRQYATVKRFYKHVNIVKSEGKYEITLDQRKLKTPQGKPFLLTSEPLALAVATEWNSQKETLLRNKMHITNLCNTVQDNPNHHSKYDLANYITNYLDTDTILFQTKEDEELYTFQANKWDPVIKWYNEKYGSNIQKSIEMAGLTIGQNDKNSLNRHFLSHDFECAYGYVFGVDTLKSVILTIACVDRFITVEEAVLLSRLEEEYQLGHWSRVEWAHDLNQQDLQARLSAVILFIHCNRQSSKIRIKEMNTANT